MSKRQTHSEPHAFKFIFLPFAIKTVMPANNDVPEDALTFSVIEITKRITRLEKL